MAMATTTYKMEAIIRGYRVYATVWDAQIGEELYCAYVLFSTSSPVRTLDVRSNFIT